MFWPTRLFRSAFAVISGLALCGCLPSGQSQLDEEKEPYFLAGKARVNSMDYKGASEAFEKALEVNPRSASAHFQLGILYEEKELDPAASIYHYEQFLKLRPGADNAEVIRSHISACKQELAKAMLPLPSTPSVQRELEQLAEENRRLRDEVERLRVYSAGRGAVPTNPPIGPGPSGRNLPDAGLGQVPAPGGNPPGGSAPVRTSGSGPVAARTHKVQAGETLASIARKYGVKLDALTAVNAGLNPTRLRIGQTLNIPAP